MVISEIFATTNAGKLTNWIQLVQSCFVYVVHWTMLVRQILHLSMLGKILNMYMYYLHEQFQINLSQIKW